MKMNFLRLRFVQFTEKILFLMRKVYEFQRFLRINTENLEKSWKIPTKSTNIEGSGGLYLNYLNELHKNLDCYEFAMANFQRKTFNLSKCPESVENQP